MLFYENAIFFYSDVSAALLRDKEVDFDFLYISMVQISCEMRAVMVIALDVSYNMACMQN